LNPDGTLRWRLRTGGITESSPVIAPDGTIYVGANNDLWAITPEGKQKWTRWAEGANETTPLVLADSSVWYVNRWGQFTRLSAAREFAASTFLSGDYGFASLGIATNGTLYGPGDYTRFYAFRNRLPLAQSPWPKFRGNPQNTGRGSDGVVE
jgi:hypothetical protein